MCTRNKSVKTVPISAVWVLQWLKQGNYNKVTENIEMIALKSLTLKSRFS